jgi:hypothetical protein
LLLLAILIPTTRADEWTSLFRDSPRSTGMTVYWVWFGPAVTRAWIDRDLANMKRASVSGATILPVYPLSPDDPAKGIRNAPLLSELFLRLIGYAAESAKELGLTLDLTLVGGWP